MSLKKEELKIELEGFERRADLCLIAKNVVREVEMDFVEFIESPKPVDMTPDQWLSNKAAYVQKIAAIHEARSIICKGEQELPKSTGLFAK